ncbi:uncharacterized protein C7orf61 homolog isoform X1 [Fukomys damarensis]|uniref:uncharacterized protein C7orf61 homolog isoform X1 n=1 Tax=Fukomys damarensis TaxID=885580 RepID=UPI0005400D1B|nr:uncharacterized protein C7orf61 homolog isoform X1 [Fukomys damarensis]
MRVVVPFFKFVKRIWQKMTCWVVFWRRQMKQTIMTHPGSKKHELEEGKTLPHLEARKSSTSPGEAKFPRMEESSKAAETCVLTSPVSRTPVGLAHEGHSLLQLPRTAVRSAPMIMFSALQSSWQMCQWKSPVTCASISSQVSTSSPLDTPEAELLRDVYLVLWAIRKQLRHLARRPERHRRHHVRANSSALAEPVLELKQDARSPL